MRIETDIKLGFKDVLIRPKRSTLGSRSQVSLNRKYQFRNSGKEWEGVPIIAANMDTVGTFEMARELAKHNLLTAVHKHYDVAQWRKFMQAMSGEDADNHFMISTGSSDNDLAKLESIINEHPSIRFICIDVANGYSESFVRFVSRTREKFQDKNLVAGNVVTGEMVEELILSGADIVKVGIGPGSVCTTRVKTGVGYPQLSAVIECADAAHGLGGHIISDGGCVSAGDVAKAFGGGADFVMLGGMLAGHDESGGDLVERDNKRYKKFYGMSSSTAMEKHTGSVADYRASEGKTVEVPYRGPVEETIKDILGGLRSACTYTGARHLKELSKRTTFIRVLEQENQTFGQEKA